MPVPVHELTATEEFLPILSGHKTVFPASERFQHNNGGYVVLAKRATGTGCHQLVRSLIWEPAGTLDTGFLRSDELPDRAARGYLFAAA